MAAGAVGGIALWYASFPEFYYMLWLFLVMLLWMAPIIVAGVHVGLQTIWQRTRGRRVHAELGGGGFLLAWLVFATTVLLGKLPLRLHFALAESTLEEIRADPPEHMTSAAGFLIDRVSEGRCDSRRTLLHIANDSESYFVYSPHGIDDLCYNSGSKGALGGNWYWMTED